MEKSDIYNPEQNNEYYKNLSLECVKKLIEQIKKDLKLITEKNRFINSFLKKYSLTINEDKILNDNNNLKIEERDSRESNVITFDVAHQKLHDIFYKLFKKLSKNVRHRNIDNMKKFYIDLKFNRDGLDNEIKNLNELKDLIKTKIAMIEKDPKKSKNIQISDLENESTKVIENLKSWSGQKNYEDLINFIDNTKDFLNSLSSVSDIKKSSTCENENNTYYKGKLYLLELIMNLIYFDIDHLIARIIEISSSEEFDNGLINHKRQFSKMSSSSIIDIEKMDYSLFYEIFSTKIENYFTNGIFNLQNQNNKDDIIKKENNMFESRVYELNNELKNEKEKIDYVAKILEKTKNEMNIHL